MIPAALLFFCSLAFAAPEAAPAVKKIEVALTIDDLLTHGELPSGVTRQQLVEQMLASIKKAGLTGVYAFITTAGSGSSQTRTKVLELWRKQGHFFGNHTYSHQSINERSAEEFIHEIKDAEPLLREAAGETDWHWFRYPYIHEGDNLEKRAAVRSHLFANGYRLAPISVPFGDSPWREPYLPCLKTKKMKQAEKMRAAYVETAVNALQAGDQLARHLLKRPVPLVLMLHVGPIEADTLDALLAAYKANGAVFVPLATALGDEVYKIDTGHTAREPLYFLQQLARKNGVNPKELQLPRFTPAQETIDSFCR